VVRKQTLNKFAKEVDEVYAKSGDKWQEGSDRYGTIMQVVETKIEVTVEERN
jgi:hypothetical protein